jgi:hypothetical protein
MRGRIFGKADALLSFANYFAKTRHRFFDSDKMSVGTGRCNRRNCPTEIACKNVSR